MNLITALLLSTSANLDTFAVAISYGIKKIKLSLFSILLITFITTTGTFISMYFGLAFTKIISVDIAAIIGSVMLIGIGLYMILDYYKKSKSKNETLAKDKLTYSQIIDNPIKADKNNSGDLDFKETITLSLALTINNLGIGVAASIAGINIYLNTICTLIITLLSIILGSSIGNSYLSKFFGKYSGLVSGLIIVALGIYECFV